MGHALLIAVFFSLFSHIKTISANTTLITTTTTTTAAAASPTIETNPNTASLPRTPDLNLNLWDYFPQTWSNICTVDYHTDPDVNATLSCHVTPSKEALWRLADLRTAISALVNDTGFELAVNIMCETGGTISLPVPFRAPGLVKLTVRNCRLLDKWGDFNTPAQQLGDWLRVQDVQDCTWANNPAEFTYLLTHLDKMTSHYECGQDSTLVYYVLKNMTQENLPEEDQLDPNDPELAALLKSLSGDGEGVSPGPAGSTSTPNTTDDPGSVLNNQSMAGNGGLLNGSDPSVEHGSNVNAPGHAGQVKSTTASPDSPDEVLDTLINLDHIQTKCLFENLEVHDESFSEDTNRNHFEFMVKDSTYPKLRLLNFTGIGLTEIPLEFRQSRRKFHGSKLGVIDISHNKIQELGLIPSYPSRGIHTTLIVRYNNITKLSLQMFKDLALVPDFTVDIRGNPFECGCEMKDFLLQFQKQTLWERSSMVYYRKHVAGLTCATPSELSGRAIGSLSVDELPCPVSQADLRPAMVVLLVLVVILLVMLALAIKYRKEVRILMYTRVHILLPCGLPMQPSASMQEKTYDAFVAYAHQDTDWVLNSLLKRLEDPETVKGRRPCKLCIHQRDFVVGKPIIDNIVDSIASSRHTIVVLTNSFVKSGWAMEELEHAYRQSIEERRRHLVVVVLEEVAQSDMGAVLRRCCKTFTYLHVSDTFFWDRLLYSLHVADSNSKNKKNASLNVEADEYDTPDPGSINKGYNSDEESRVGSPTTPPVMMDEELKRTLFLETMRSLSVDSSFSTVGESTAPITPSQVHLDRPLFETSA